MVSAKTLQEIAKVILRHVTPEVADAICQDLMKVQGNKSYTDTVHHLGILLQRITLI